MRVTSSVLVLTITLALALSSSPVSATVLVYGGELNAANEAPTPSFSSATGQALVFFDRDALSMRVRFTFENLEGVPLFAHIHCCILPNSVSAGVATELPSFDGFPLPGAPQSGVYDRTFDLSDAGNFNPSFLANNGGTVLSAVDALAVGLDAGRAYLNVHTTFYQAGEIRANLVRVSEPALGALWFAGLGAALVMRARLRKRTY